MVKVTENGKNRRKRRVCLLSALLICFGIVLSGCKGKNESPVITPTPDESGQTVNTEGTEGNPDFETNAVAAPVFTATTSGITVTLTTDKGEYAEGEEIHYFLTIQNDRVHYKVDKTVFNYTNQMNFVAPEGTELPFEIPVVDEGKSVTIEGVLVHGEGVGTTNHAAKTAGSDAEKVTFRPYVNVMYAGQEVLIRTVMDLNIYQKYLSISSSKLFNNKEVTCHDPSIFKDFDGTYYIIGSFLDGASTTDLINWTSLNSKFQNAFSKETREQIKAWNDDEKSTSWNGYLWAPDIVYNTSMNKYCMYISANGDNWVSNIVMCTADNIMGPYEYAGSVVYGGFVADTFAQTDAPQVLGTDTIPERYVTNGVKNRKWGDKFPNCIDPCVFYDDDGNLWMTYGSWSGGIFMLELDEETGLRDYSVKYQNNNHSDEYFGKKIAGGLYVSGEASYIQKIGDYYYLFVSYGALEADGGYNVRVYRSSKPDGRYLDELGNEPFYDTRITNHAHSQGVRLFGSYKWRTFTNAQLSQGHNSAFVDDDGKAFIVFHTRTNNGTEYHYVKTHQLFTNKEGWLVAAPYQYCGESLPETPLTVDQIVGEYDIIMHTLDYDFKNKKYNKSKCSYLNADGTVTGEYEGTWKLEEGTSYITVTIKGVNYSGVVLEMNIEETKISTVVFTALGDENQLTLWGSKVVQ